MEIIKEKPNVENLLDSSSVELDNTIFDSGCDCFDCDYNCEECDNCDCDALNYL